MGEATAIIQRILRGIDAGAGEEGSEDGEAILPGTTLAAYLGTQAFAEGFGVEVHAVFVGAGDDGGEGCFVDGQDRARREFGEGLADGAVARDLAGDGDPGGAHLIGQDTGGEEGWILDGDGDGLIVGGVEFSLEEEIGAVGIAGEPDGVFVAGDAVVLDIQERGRWIGGEGDTLADRAGLEVKIKAIGVEIHPGNAGDVREVQLFDRPTGVDEVLIEDAVVDEHIVHVGDTAVFELGGPSGEDGGGFPAETLEERGIAESGIAISDEDDIIASADECGAEFEIGAEHIDGGGGGDEFQIAGGDEGDIALVFEKNGAGGRICAEANEFDAHVGPGQEFVLEDGADSGVEISGIEISARVGGEKEGQARGNRCNPCARRMIHP